MKINNETETAMKSSPPRGKKKGQGPIEFTAEFYPTFKKKLMPTLLKLYHGTERERILPHSFCEAVITLIPKLEKDTHKENYRPANFFNGHRCKSSQ
jgi:hypothetical protein